MVPADGKIYGLRDVTGTVESIPLIVGSIISKKVAEGAEALVFDVKWGQGAFMSEMDGALELAARLVEEAERFGRNALAFVTDMNQPLGKTVGNSLELLEAMEMLKGKGPRDLRALTLLLGAAMLDLAGKVKGLSEGVMALEAEISSGRALKTLEAMVEAQGGDAAFIDDPSSLGRAAFEVEVPSPGGGYVSSIDTLGLGFLVCDMGGGRARAGERIDHNVGAALLKKRGEEVRKDEPLALLHLSKDSRKEDFVRRAAKLYTLSEEPPARRPLVSWKVDSQGAEQWDDSGVPKSVRCKI
jgi:pyrimidine-nucleoside phosphorylase